MTPVVIAALKQLEVRQINSVTVKGQDDDGTYELEITGSKSRKYLLLRINRGKDHHTLWQLRDFFVGKAGCDVETDSISAVLRVSYFFEF